MAEGKILQVIGPVVDIVFPEREVPEILNAVKIEDKEKGIDLTAEVSSKYPYRLYKPGLENDVTNAVIERFITDGNLKVVKDYDEADSVVSGKLTEYVREPLRYDDNENVIEFRIRVVVSAKFVNKKDNKAIWQASDFAGESSQRTGGTLEKTEDTAKNEAVDDLARRVVEKTIEVW